MTSDSHVTVLALYALRVNKSLKKVQVFRWPTSRISRTSKNLVYI